MISETEKHISPLFFPSFDEGLPSAGPHVCPAAPSQTLQDQAKAHSHHISLFPGEVIAALFWEQVGGGKDLFIYFFLPSPFILLQALIIEGLNLSCSCLLPSFPDSIPNKGLWFEFEGFFFSVFFSPPEI